MTQNAEHVLDHFELFRGPEYQEMLANKKKMFENPARSAEVERIREWAKTPEYREKNFAREALTVNPAKACQPLGAVFAAVGFEGPSRSSTARRAASPIIAAICRGISRSRALASRPR